MVMNYLNQKILHCLFNWDHPFCLTQWDNKKNRQITSKNIWDIVFVTGDCKLQEYIDSGSKEAYYLRMFTDQEVHYPEKDKEYECDISLVCTNLYEDTECFPNKILNRKTLIKKIIEENIDMRIYGPEHLKNNFPNNYYGIIHFLDNHKVFYNSKINFCTHVTNGHKYCNERVGTVLSSGGLLFCDKVNGIEKILTDGKDCILINDNNYINQIKEILKNYDNYKHIKEQALITAKEKFSPKCWAKFINNKIIKFVKNNPYNGININPVYSFNNYQKEKVSIVMTYYNRLDQIKNTLSTIEESKYPKDLIEVICFDDGSDKEPLIINTSIYSFNIKIIYGNYDKDKAIINPTYSYNNAFKYLTGEYVIIQNSECMHIGDIISYVSEKLKDNNNLFLSVPCWATANDEISNEIFINRFNSDKLKNIMENKYKLLNDYPPEFKGWYNEKRLRPECLHFCNAFHNKTFKNKIGLFNTKIERILGFDDNEFAERILFRTNLEIEIPEHNFKLFVVHQYHGKYNKPRPTNLFLKSYDEYRIIDNYNKNNFIKKNNSNSLKIINYNYSNINKEEFLQKINNEWCDCFVYLNINEEEIDDIFIRKCFKNSNFRIEHI